MTCFLHLKKERSPLPGTLNDGSWPPYTPTGLRRQSIVSRRAKCYRRGYRRATTRVTHQGGMSMGRIRVGPQAIEAYLRRMRERYETAPRAKGRLVDEVCAVTRYHRKAVIRLLRRAAVVATSVRRPTGAVRPGGGGGAAGDRTAAGYPWSVRLKALLPLWRAVGAAARAPARRTTSPRLDRVTRRGRMPSRLTVLNPGRVNVTCRRQAAPVIRYVPEPSVTAVRTFSMRLGWQLQP